LKPPLVMIALIAATGVAGAAYAQTSPPTTQPGTPTMPTQPGKGMPGGTPGTGADGTTKAPNRIATEAAAKAQLEAKGYTGIRQLKRDSGGNWTGKAQKNNSEVAVTLDNRGNVREQ
jgi:hypothetical protein